MSSRIEEQDFTAEKVDLSIWKRLYAFALLNRPLLMLILASLVIVSLVDVAYPLLSRYAIDHFVTPRITDGIVPFAAVYAALVILQAAGTFLFISRSGKMEMEIAYAIRQQAFEKLMQGRTSFVVAHRLSTIQSADRILVMNAGHIIEQGTHAELLAKQGFYANLYNSQFAVE